MHRTVRAYLGPHLIIFKKTETDSVSMGGNQLNCNWNTSYSQESAIIVSFFRYAGFHFELLLCIRWNKNWYGKAIFSCESHEDPSSTSLIIVPIHLICMLSSLQLGLCSVLDCLVTMTTYQICQTNKKKMKTTFQPNRQTVYRSINKLIYQ